MSLGERLQPPESRFPRHVLVCRGGAWVPGILLEWVTTGHGWHGRAVWAHGNPLQVTVGLVPATDLRPLGETGRPVSSAPPDVPGEAIDGRP